MLLRWLSHTLVGHIVFFEAIGGLPAILWGVESNYRQGSLTLAFGIEMILEMVAIVGATATAIWFTVTVSLKQRMRE